MRYRCAAAVACLTMLAPPPVLMAKELQPPVSVYLFWQRGCPHCERQIGAVAEAEARDPALRVHYFELGSAQNRRLYLSAARSLGMREAAVPLTVVGETAFVGFIDERHTDEQLQRLIAECRQRGCTDALAPLVRELQAASDPALALREIRGAPPTANLDGTRDSARERVKLPWGTVVDLRALSLPAVTVVLALVDGFNPCALWVLVFLIGLLLGLQDRARRWLLGGVFLLTTAAMYYAVMAAWLGALLVIGASAWLRVAMGLLALAGGVYYVQEYVRHPEALCRVASASRRERIMAGLRTAAGEPRFGVAMAAIVVLAVGVNFIELLCSAGIPAVYVQILALTPMTPWQYYAWLALYVLVFLLDDLVIFAGAMLTLELAGLSGRYAHHAQLAGGVVLIVVGILLVLRPGWLSFG